MKTPGFFYGLQGFLRFLRFSFLKAVFGIYLLAIRLDRRASRRVRLHATPAPPRTFVTIMKQLTKQLTKFSFEKQIYGYSSQLYSILYSQ